MSSDHRRFCSTLFPQQESKRLEGVSRRFEFRGGHSTSSLRANFVDSQTLLEKYPTSYSVSNVLDSLE